jgi:hypothetical protein
MKKQHSYSTVLLLLFCFAAGTVYAQESINAGGGNATGSGGSVSYSIGQVAYTTVSSSNGSVAQGVQHAFDIIPVSIRENQTAMSLTAFPNPVSDNLVLQLNNLESSLFMFQVADAKGKILRNGQITSVQTHISMSDLPVATYFIHIWNQANEKVQSYKVIKN